MNIERQRKYRQLLRNAISYLDFAEEYCNKNKTKNADVIKRINEIKGMIELLQEIIID